MSLDVSDGWEVIGAIPVIAQLEFVPFGIVYRLTVRIALHARNSTIFSLLCLIVGGDAQPCFVGCFVTAI